MSQENIKINTQEIYSPESNLSNAERLVKFCKDHKILVSAALSCLTMSAILNLNIPKTFAETISDGEDMGYTEPNKAQPVNPNVNNGNPNSQQLKPRKLNTNNNFNQNQNYRLSTGNSSISSGLELSVNNRSNSEEPGNNTEIGAKLTVPMGQDFLVSGGGTIGQNGHDASVVFKYSPNINKDRSAYDRVKAGAIDTCQNLTTKKINTVYPNWGTLSDKDRELKFDGLVTACMIQLKDKNN